MIPTLPPSGENLRDRRRKVQDMIRECVSRNPVPFIVFKDLKNIKAGFDVLIKQVEKMESQAKKDKD